MKIFASVFVTVLISIVIKYSSAKPTRSLGQSKFPVYIKVLNEDNLKYGAVFSAECTAESNEITDIKWVRESFKNRAYFSQFDNKIIMTINSIIPMDFGRYTCIATRSDGIQVSNSIRIERNPSYGNKFRYRLDTERQATGTSEQLKTEEIKPDKSKEDKKQEQLHDDYEHNLLGAVSDQTDVRITQDFQTYTHEGEMVTFNCLINNQVVSDIAWTRNHGFMPSNHRIVDNVLIIYNITASDTGYYICSYKDKSTYVYLGLVRRGYPITHVKIPSLTKQINVVEGDSVEIDCKVVGELDTDLRWEKHLGVLPDNAVVEDNKLKISNVQIPNYGYYECLGHNVLGNFSDFIYLDVKNKTELLAREKIIQGRLREDDNSNVEPIENETTFQIVSDVTTSTAASESESAEDDEDPSDNDSEETGETAEPNDETTLEPSETEEHQPTPEQNDGEITNEATDNTDENQEVEIEAEQVDPVTPTVQDSTTAETPQSTVPVVAEEESSMPTEDSSESEQKTVEETPASTEEVFAPTEEVQAPAEEAPAEEAPAEEAPAEEAPAEEAPAEEAPAEEAPVEETHAEPSEEASDPITQEPVEESPAPEEVVEPKNEAPVESTTMSTEEAPVSEE